jgi:hypothetical protein
MTKTHMDNAKDDKKWRRNNIKVGLPTNNNEIATKNNKGCQKGMLQTP